MSSTQSFSLTQLRSLWDALRRDRPASVVAVKSETMLDLKTLDPPTLANLHAKPLHASNMALDLAWWSTDKIRAALDAEEICLICNEPLCGPADEHSPFLASIFGLDARPLATWILRTFELQETGEPKIDMVFTCKGAGDKVEISHADCLLRMAANAFASGKDIKCLYNASNKNSQTINWLALGRTLFLRYAIEAGIEEFSQRLVAASGGEYGEPFYQANAEITSAKNIGKMLIFGHSFPDMPLDEQKLCMDVIMKFPKDFSAVGEHLFKDIDGKQFKDYTNVMKTIKKLFISPFSRRAFLYWVEYGFPPETYVTTEHVYGALLDIFRNSSVKVSDYTRELLLDAGIAISKYQKNFPNAFNEETEVVDLDDLFGRRVGDSISDEMVEELYELLIKYLFYNKEFVHESMDGMYESMSMVKFFIRAREIIKSEHPTLLHPGWLSATFMLIPDSGIAKEFAESFRGLTLVFKKSAKHDELIDEFDIYLYPTQVSSKSTYKEVNEISAVKFVTALFAYDWIGPDYVSDLFIPMIRNDKNFAGVANNIERFVPMIVKKFPNELAKGLTDAITAGMMMVDFSLVERVINAILKEFGQDERAEQLLMAVLLLPGIPDETRQRIRAQLAKVLGVAPAQESKRQKLAEAQLKLSRAGLLEEMRDFLQTP